MKLWSDKQITAAQKILRKYPIHQFQQAVNEISKTLGREVTADSLCGAFARNKLNAPSTYCTSKAAPKEESDSKEKQKAVVESVVEAAPDPTKMLEERAIERDRRRLKGERDALLDQLEDANSRANFVEAIGKSRAPRIIPRESVSGLREGALVALASDWHLEEVVTLDSTAGRNEYNLEIGQRRAHRFFSGIQWLLSHHRHDFAIRDLILWFGGDFFSGYIHEELTETNELSPVESVLHVKQVLSDGLHTLLADSKLERIVIPSSYGNHGRITAKRRIKNGAEMSYEWLLYNVLAQEFSNEKRIQFEINRSPHQYVEAYGKTLHFHHGDDVVYHGGVGGLNVPLGKRVPQWDTVRYADLHHIGHFHQCRDFGRAVVNGSLIGFNDYAMSIGAAYEGPQQQSYVLDSKRGKCMVTPIWVDDTDKVETEAA